MTGCAKPDINPAIAVVGVTPPVAWCAQAGENNPAAVTIATAIPRSRVLKTLTLIDIRADKPFFIRASQTKQCVWAIGGHSDLHDFGVAIESL
jgi:hypothetical protein